MHEAQVVAVVGSCTPERSALARRLADDHGAEHFGHHRLTHECDPVRSAAEQALWMCATAPIVIDFPSFVQPTDIIGTLADPTSRISLRNIVAVVDATDLLLELQRDDYLPPYADHVDSHTAAALVAVQHIELATDIVVVNWQHLGSSELATFIALLSALAPTATLTLNNDHPITLSSRSVERIDAARCGWLELLNDAHTPAHRNPRVVAFRYEQVRPLHPKRLEHLLDARIERGEFGHVLRSAGFCQFATRPDQIAVWEHVGQMIAFTPVSAPPDEQGEPTRSVGQDLAVIGIDIDQEGLTAALDEASLNDAELLADPATWLQFTDPYPAWPNASQSLE